MQQYRSHATNVYSICPRIMIQLHRTLIQWEINMITNGGDINEKPQVKSKDLIYHRIIYIITQQTKIYW